MLAQLLLYAGSALLVGGVAVRHLVTPGSPRLRWLPTGLLLLVAGAVWKTQAVLRELDMLNLTDTLGFPDAGARGTGGPATGDRGVRAAGRAPQP